MWWVIGIIVVVLVAIVYYNLVSFINKHMIKHLERLGDKYNTRIFLYTYLTMTAGILLLFSYLNLKSRR